MIDYLTLSRFFSDISVMIPVSDSTYDILSVLSKDAEEDNWKQCLETMADSMDQGDSLSEVMTASEQFPSYAIRMIASAERAGKMEEVCASLSLYYDRKEKMRALAEATLLQPLMLLALLGGTLIVFMAVILPLLSGVYRQMGNVGGIYVPLAYGLAGLALLVILAVILTLLYLWIQSRRQDFLQTFAARDLEEMYEKAAFFMDLQTRISGGILLEQAFEEALEGIHQEKLKNVLEKASKRLQAGESFSMVLMDAQLLPHVCHHWIVTGIRSGNMEEAIRKVSDHLYEEAERKTEDRIRKVEPLITGFFTIMVSASLLILLVPLIGVLTAIG